MYSYLTTGYYSIDTHTGITLSIYSDLTTGYYSIDTHTGIKYLFTPSTQSYYYLTTGYYSIDTHRNYTKYLFLPYYRLLLH